MSNKRSHARRKVRLLEKFENILYHADVTKVLLIKDPKEMLIEIWYSDNAHVIMKCKFLEEIKHGPS